MEKWKRQYIKEYFLFQILDFPSVNGKAQRAAFPFAGDTESHAREGGANDVS